jgi:hypothetical protein
MPIDFKLTKVSLQTTEHMESITLHNLYLTCSCDDRYKLQSTRIKIENSITLHVPWSQHQSTIGYHPFSSCF